MTKPHLLLKISNLATSLFLLIGLTKSYSQDIQWEKSIGGQQADYLMDAQPTADYGFILAGSSLSIPSGTKSENNKGDLDYWIWKMNEKGNLDWQKSFGGSGADFLESIALTNDGGFILAGESSSPGTASDNKKDGDKIGACRGNDDFWIIKLNAAGGEEWQKTIGGFGEEKLKVIKQTKDGGYIIGGASSSDQSGDKKQDCFGNLDYWIVKLDTKGTIEWQKTYGGSYFDILRSLEQTTDGGYIVGGYSNSPASGNKATDTNGIGDFWILKLDAKGQQVWQKTIGGDQDDQLYVVHQTFDGNYIVGGNSNSGVSNEKNKSTANGTDFWVLKLDQDGGILWQETYDIGAVDILTSLLENKDHTLVLSGFAQGEPIKKAMVSKPKLDTAKNLLGSLTKKTNTTNSPENKDMKSGTGDYVTIKTNEKGDEIWRKTIGSRSEDILKKTIEVRDGGYLLVGTSMGAASEDKKTTNGSADFWAVKLKDKENWVDTKAQIEALPNPANTYTNIIIGYDFEKGTARVFDLNGRQLQEFAITSRTVPIDVGEEDTLRDTTHIDIAISSVFSKRKGNWSEEDFSREEENRIQSRFKTEIISKLEKYTNSKAKDLGY